MVKRVVIEVIPAFEVIEGGMVSARFFKLGLSAYGTTPQYAFRRLQAMVHYYIKAHRSSLTLEEVLNRSGVVWAWEDQYKGVLPLKDGKVVLRSVLSTMKAKSPSRRGSILPVALVA